MYPKHKSSNKCATFLLQLYFILQEGETLTVSFIEAVLPSLTPVLQSREVSRQHRLDVKALALMCAEVQTLQRLNEADFYLPMWTD